MTFIENFRQNSQISSLESRSRISSLGHGFGLEFLTRSRSRRLRSRIHHCSPSLCCT